MPGRRLLYVVAAALLAGVLSAEEPAAVLSSPQSRAQLAQTYLAEATCPAATGRNFANQSLVNHNFNADPPGSLRNANFENADLRGAVFAEQDLTGASFKNANLGPSAPGRPASFAKATLERACFVRATLNATDFTYAKFTCTDFTGTSLMEAEFGPSQDIVAGNNCRTSFAGATIDVNAIETEHWGKSDFSFTDFKNVSPQTFTLADADITNALLDGANFSGIDLTGANLTGVRLKNGKLIKSKMANTALNGADLSGTDLSFATLTCARFFGSKTDDKDNPNGALCTATPVSSAPRVAAKLIQSTLSGVDLTNATLNAAVLRGASLAGATLRRASFIDAWLEPEGNILATSLLGADLTSANFTRAHVNQVAFENVLLSMGVFDDSTLNGTKFSGSIMPLASFNRSILQNVTFSAAILQGAKFRGATMQTTPQSQGTGVIFACAHLGGADFTDAKVLSADFQAAVMPAEEQCCPEIGGGFYCGLMDGVQQTYGAVRFPILTTAMPCPNATVAKCSGSAWSIPTWRTALCNRDRVDETVWRKPDCGTSPKDYVVFADKKLETCILQSLPGSPAGVTLVTAGQMTHVSCPGKGITSIGGLEKFTKLVSLDLTGNQLTSFALPVKPLQTLKIGGNRLTSLNLTGTNVVRLDASGNQLASIAGIAGISFIVLDVARNNLTSLDLAVQDPLVYADLSFNRLTNVLDDRNSSLNRLKGLVYLDLSNNSLKTIGSATSIAFNTKTSKGTLESLFLRCNATFDCATLALNGDYTAYQTSACADFNSQTKQWNPRPQPSCAPTSE